MYLTEKVTSADVTHTPSCLLAFLFLDTAISRQLREFYLLYSDNFERKTLTCIDSNPPKILKTTCVLECFTLCLNLSPD